MRACGVPSHNADFKTYCATSSFTVERFRNNTLERFALHLGLGQREAWVTHRLCFSLITRNNTGFPFLPCICLAHHDMDSTDGMIEVFLRCDWYLLLPYILGPPPPPMGICIKGFPPPTKVNSKPPMEPPPPKGPAPPKGEGPPPPRLPPPAMPIFICILYMKRLCLA